MPRATIKGVECRVVVNSDLVDNWAVEVFPPYRSQAELKGLPEYVSMARPSTVCVKIRADTREEALKAALESLKAHGRIDDFFIEPEFLPKPPDASAAKKPAEGEEEAAEE